jgi:hypothetical protein
MDGTVANAEKFRKILEERQVTPEQFTVFIGRYASRVNLSPINVNITKRILVESFASKTMTDKLFEKGLMIIGLVPAEIKKVLETA